MMNGGSSIKRGNGHATWPEPASLERPEPTGREIDGLAADVAVGLVEWSGIILELARVLSVALLQLEGLATRHGITEIEEEARQAGAALREIALPTVLLQPVDAEGT